MVVTAVVADQPVPHWRRCYYRSSIAALHVPCASRPPGQRPRQLHRHCHSHRRLTIAMARATVVAVAAVVAVVAVAVAKGVVEQSGDDSP